MTLDLSLPRAEMLIVNASPLKTKLQLRHSLRSIGDILKFKFENAAPQMRGASSVHLSNFAHLLSILPAARAAPAARAGFGRDNQE